MDMLTAHNVAERFKILQDHICSELEKLDGVGLFQEDLWKRPEGGGGRTRIINGQHIVKGGVNFSHVHGVMPETIAKGLGLEPNQFSATGVSIVLHARNPFVPIIHMNVRYFETDTGSWWFGGGIDLTPLIVIEEDAVSFHQGLKEVCDQYEEGAYAEFKEWADNYFYIPHRNETRGVGGIFFDRLGQQNERTKTDIFNYVVNVGESFYDLYSDIFIKRFQTEYSEEHIKWQRLRRGRYVEFNLVYDRGTKFGLQTNGRIESILMSLPPQVEYRYDYRPSKEFELTTQSFLKKGISWI